MIRFIILHVCLLFIDIFIYETKEAVFLFVIVVIFNNPKVNRNITIIQIHLAFVFWYLFI